MGDRLEREIDEIIRAKGDLPQPPRRATRRPQERPEPATGRRFSFRPGQLMLASISLLLVSLLLWQTTSWGFWGMVALGGVLLFIIAYALSFGKTTPAGYEKRWRGQPIHYSSGTPWRVRLRNWLKRLRH